MSGDLDEQQRRVLRALLAMQRQSWEQGVASHALIDLGLIDEAVLLAHDAVVRQTDAGKLGEVDDVGIVNCGACGEAVRLAARIRPDGPYATALSRQLEWLLRTAPRSGDGVLFHVEGTREMWVDTVYMVVPLLFLVGEAREARRQFEGHRDRLYDAATGLWSWRWDEDLGMVSHPRHWGTGNGWVVAGIARAMRSGGADDPWFRDVGPAHVRTVADACLATRSVSGAFHDVLDDPASFEEGNVGQMLAYALLAGVTDGWLPDVYRAPGMALVERARARVEPDGIIRGVCGAPRFDRSGTSPEAQAMFLLATAAAQRLSESR